MLHQHLQVNIFTKCTSCCRCPRYNILSGVVLARTPQRPQAVLLLPTRGDVSLRNAPDGRGKVLVVHGARACQATPSGLGFDHGWQTPLWLADILVAGRHPRDWQTHMWQADAFSTARPVAKGLKIIVSSEHMRVKPHKQWSSPCQRTTVTTYVRKWRLYCGRDTTAGCCVTQPDVRPLQNQAKYVCDCVRAHVHVYVVARVCNSTQV